MVRLAEPVLVRVTGTETDCPMITFPKSKDAGEQVSVPEVGCVEPANESAGVRNASTTNRVRGSLGLRWGIAIASPVSSKPSLSA
jgi:hypothetical protein